MLYFQCPVESTWGPRPVRSASGPGLYGLPDLLPSRAMKVKTDAILALRVAALAKAFHTAGKPFIIENPAPRRGVPSIFNLNEYLSLLALPGVDDDVFVQCPFGSYSVKPTLLLPGSYISIALSIFLPAFATPLEV